MTFLDQNARWPAKTTEESHAFNYFFIKFLWIHCDYVHIVIKMLIHTEREMNVIKKSLKCIFLSKLLLMNHHPHQLGLIL